MMNLEKIKQKKSKNRVKKGLLAATTFLCLTTPLLQTQTAYAAENTTPAITIEKPDGWKQGETTIAVTVDASHMPEGFSIAKMEAKAGKDGSWQDVTGSGSITIIEEITGEEVQYVRPPYGSWDKSFEKELNMFPVLWNVDPLDWCSKNVACITKKIVSKAEENDIILMHDYYETSVTAALRAIDELMEGGYTFVTVEEILFD